MNKECKTAIEQDKYRLYFGEKEKLLNKLFRPMELKYLICYRKASLAKNKIAKLFYMMKLRRLSEKTQIQIPWNTKIGRGLFIAHTGRIIINQGAVLGDNINLATGIVIGVENRGKRRGNPTIGNKVWIGANAVIVGKINIGNDVLIAPNSFVNVDVPDHSVVVGNPCVIHPNPDATYNYVSCPIE